MGSWDFRPVYGNHYEDDFLIRNFTLAELKQLKRNQRYDIRNQDLNGIFDIMTLEETIDLMFQLQKERPFPHRKHKIGLYIETKMYEFYLQQFGEDIAVMLYKVLEKYNLHTIEKCQDVLPIIIECFEGQSL